MIELPRAALKADEIAAGEFGAEFFSFGTNDLTQTCLGLSRDDAAPILASYTQHGVFEVDPFVSIDQDGRRRIGAFGHRARAPGAPRPQGRHLRRARRRPGLHRLLPPSRPRLRVLLGLPRAGRASGRRASGDRREGGSLDSLSRPTSRSPLSARVRSIAPVSARWPAGRARRGDCGRGGGDARASSGRRAAPLVSGCRQS